MIEYDNLVFDDDIDDIEDEDSGLIQMSKFKIMCMFNELNIEFKYVVKYVFE